MKRTLRAEEARLWALVASTVRPAPGRAALFAPEGPAAERSGRDDALRAQTPPTGPGAADGRPLSGRTAQGPSPAPKRGRGSDRSGPGEWDMDGVTAQGRKRLSPALPTLDPHPIEPLRRRRIARDRDAIGARLDLHGLDQDRARASLHGFLLRAYAQGHRAVLVITGKGALGDGVLRRRAPEWLSEAVVRPLIAGVSQADRRHGGAGALYIALKRRPS